MDEVCTTDVTDNPLLQSSLVIAALHSELDCTWTTVFQDTALENRFVTFLVLELVLYSVHMFAASLAGFQFGDSLVDQARFISLFVSAVAKVLDRTSRVVDKGNIISTKSLV